MLSDKASNIFHIIKVITDFAPKYQLRLKEHSGPMRFLAKFFGPEFLTDVWTTVGYTTYCPLNCPDDAWMILAHEGRHVVQAKKLTRVLFGLLYLIPFPTVFRLNVELAAYQTQLICYTWVYGAASALVKIQETTDILTQDYMLVWPNKKKIFGGLLQAVIDANTGKALDDPYHRAIHDEFVMCGIIKP